MDTYFLSKAVFKIIKSPSTRWKLKKAVPGIFFTPHMKQDEFEFFRQVCKNNNVFLEYGSGGSTIYLLNKQKTIYSVESNPEFLKFMTSIELVKKSLNDRLYYEYIDLGATNQWGKPIDTEASYTWDAYYKKIWEKIELGKKQVDVIFIDGRFRVCCCLYSVLKLLEHNWKNTTLLIHDFWRRKEYHSVLEFLEEIKSVRNLAHFKLRKNIDRERITEVLMANALVTQ